MASPEIARPSVHAESRSRPAMRAVRRHREVALALTVADLRARYGRGPSRVVKWLLDPYALLGVYLLLVTFVLDQPGFAPGLSLACAIVPFQLVMSSVQYSTTAVEMRQSALLNMSYERTLIPVATVLTEVAAFFASMSLIALTMAVYRVEPTVAILWFPALFVVTVTLALGLAFPATLFGVWFPQLRAFATSAVRALFFLSPGLVALSAAQDDSEGLLRLNPFTGIFESYRAVFLFGESPQPTDLLYPFACGLVLLAVFIPIYRSEQAHLAKVVG